jgi:hypothetical protein
VAISTRVTFQSNEYVLSVAELGLAPAKGLQVVGTLADVEFEIRRAIDRLFTGF